MAALPARHDDDNDGTRDALDKNDDNDGVVDEHDDDDDNGCPPQPHHDAHAAEITDLGTIPGSPAVTKTVNVRVTNQGDHTETIGVYVDVIPPGGSSNPYGCAPTGRVIEITVTLAAGESQTVSSAPQSFSCSNVAGARGKSYTIGLVADAHAGDLAWCGVGKTLTVPCYQALADDDNDDPDNWRSRNTPRIVP